MEVTVVTTRRLVTLAVVAPIVLAILALLSALSFADKKAPKPKIFAQKLVEEVLAKYSEVTGVEIAVRSPETCSTVAATDPKDVGEKCDKDELDPMRTGQPSVEKERDGFDVTLPLHDAAGQVIGAVGMGFKLKSGQERSTVLEQARQIVQEMEAQIPASAKLLEPVD
jgi:hypothetical protein